MTLPSQVQQVVPHKQRVDLSENVLRMNVSVLNIESPGVFFVRNQLSQKIFDSMAGLADYLNEKGQLVPLEELVPGVVCAIKGSTEGKWLRCRILQVGNGKWAKVVLIDVGEFKNVECTKIFSLKQLRWQMVEDTALLCKLWGICQVKEAQSLYCQEYFRDEENGCVIRHIRLYYEFVIPAEALTIDQVATGCINEELVNKGLALKKWMIAKVESNVLQWPTSRIALFKFNALTRYIDSEGFLYLVHEKKTAPTVIVNP